MPRMKKAEEAKEVEISADTDSTEENKTKGVIKRRRGRPPLKKTKAKRRGRPKGSKTKKTRTITENERDIKQALRSKIKELRAEIVSSKRDFRRAIREQKEIAKVAEKELKEALKREQALIQLFEKKAEAVSRFADQWTAEQIEIIQTPPKRRRRRKKAA